MKVVYKLAGQVVNPVNRKGIYFEINHDQGAIINQPYPNVGIKNLYFAREDVKYIMSLLAQSPGITEAIPLEIEMSERGQTETLECLVNPMNGFKRGKDGIQTDIMLRESLDWLENVVQSFTFESLYNDITVYNFQVDGITYATYQEYLDKRCIFIPYVISTFPNFIVAFQSMFTLLYIGNELYKVTKQIIQWASPSAGVIAVVHVAQIIAQIIFAALLIAA